MGQVTSGPMASRLVNRLVRSRMIQQQMMPVTRKSVEEEPIDYLQSAALVALTSKRQQKLGTSTLGGISQAAIFQNMGHVHPTTSP